MSDCRLKADICIIGAGSAGLSVAAGAARLGARTILIEEKVMGGDCLNTGCVPSKSMLAVAKLAHAVGQVSPTDDAGIFSFAQIHDRIHDVIQAIAPHDSEERFIKLGCNVIRAHAYFVDRHTVKADSYLISARRFVIATGSRPAVPPIPGLEQIPFFTNETLFDNRSRPQHLLIIGGGPVGVEMAQAHCRLGSRVTIVARSSLLSKDDRDAVEIVRNALIKESVDVREYAKISHIQQVDGHVAVKLSDKGGEHEIEVSHVLVAVGRIPNTENLGLDRAGIRSDKNGIVVDARLRTTNHRVYAMGDVASNYRFTHLASYHAGIVVQNALFRLPAKVNLAAFPWVTYTDPELAQVGLTEIEARIRHGKRVKVLCEPFANIDRAQTDGEAVGFAKVMVTNGGRVLGATIVGHGAGELLLPWILCVGRCANIRDIARAIVPYPSQSEISKRIAGNFYAPHLFGNKMRSLVRILGWFG